MSPQFKICFVVIFWMLISGFSYADDTERDWYPKDNTKVENWHSAIHAEAGVDCHGCHVDSPTAKKKTVIWEQNHPITVTLLSRSGYDARCETCHANATQTFRNTFHGKHQRLGKANVPTCSFCHAGHEQSLASNINPLHPTQIGRVCAGCHSADSEHIKAAIISNTTSTIRMHEFPKAVTLLGFDLSDWIRGFYTLLLIGVVGFFVVYFILDIPIALKTPKFITAHSMTASTKVLHLLFACSFVMLALTGFSVKYPDSSLSGLMMALLSDADIRSLIHRISAIIFVGSAYSFFVYAVINRFNIAKLLPKRAVLSALKKSLRIRFGFEKIETNQESQATISWITKFGFWTSVIGIHIVLVTGLIMWFMEWTLANLGYEIFKYAQLIHGWEAILAVLTIFLVHGYTMVVRPLLAPRNTKDSNTCQQRTTTK